MKSILRSASAALMILGILIHNPSYSAASAAPSFRLSALELEEGFVQLGDEALKSIDLKRLAYRIEGASVLRLQLDQLMDDFGTYRHRLVIQPSAEGKYRIVQSLEFVFSADRWPVEKGREERAVQEFEFEMLPSEILRLSEFERTEVIQDLTLKLYKEMRDHFQKYKFRNIDIFDRALLETTGEFVRVSMVNMVIWIPRILKDYPDAIRKAQDAMEKSGAS